MPDPRFPFLGVHFTRLVGGGAEAGPNAVPALAREGYTKTSFNLRDALRKLAYPGVWKLLVQVRRHGGRRALPLVREARVREGAAEAHAGHPRARTSFRAARACARRRCERDGTLEDDFVLATHGRIVHVLNAPSPAATASLAIGGRIAEAVTAMRT